MYVLIRQSRYLIAPLAALLLLVWAIAFEGADDRLQQIKARGHLIVATLPGPTSYYEDQHGPTGFEYELVSAFADHLGVKLKVIAATDHQELFSLVRHGHADIAAAILAPTLAKREELLFTTAYHQSSDALIYRQSHARPRSMADLGGRRGAVLAGSAQEDVARYLQHTYQLDVQLVTGANAERLLNLVDEGMFDYAVVDSNSYRLLRTLYPELAEGPALNDRDLGWALRQNGDLSLYQEAQRYLMKAKADGTVTALEQRFYKPQRTAQLDYYSARAFMKHLDERLPHYLGMFQTAAKHQDLDWRLLAAVGYQESHWNPDAVSPTGVRGLMMLTRPTAAQMGISDRTDPAESVRAGAAYLRNLYDRMPERIDHENRILMALAAYNAGFGHLEDARVLTQRQGGDPDSWEDVRQRLPLLLKPEYYTKARHGYARGGGQAVVYVRNIQHYFETLVWATRTERHGRTLLALAD